MLIKNDSRAEHGEDTVPEERAPSVEIRAEIVSQITFASHQHDVAVIADLAIINSTSNALENLTLHISAEPKVFGERDWPIDRIAAESELRISDRRVAIAGTMLNELTERMRSDIRIELLAGETVLAKSAHVVTALARNEWGGARYMPELLAAFVMPNDPAIQRLLREASKILKNSNRLSSLEGYQSKSRKRSWEIVSGIWAAVVARGLTYAEPPASFETEGQKIRLPSAIEKVGLTTCLDTALLFAAAIEQAGLNPILVLTRAHALCGFWLQPQTLPDLTIDDPMEIRKAIDQKELVLFETTIAAAGEALPFSKAIRAGRDEVAEGFEADFVYAIDITRARNRQIQPLSSRSVDVNTQSGAEGQAGRASPALDVPPELPVFDTGTAEEEAPSSPEERLDRWKRSLLDLSKRNRLLNLRSSKTAISIFCPDPAKLEDKIAAGKRISIITPPPRTTQGEIDPALYRLRTGEEYAERLAKGALEHNEIVANTDKRSLEKGAIELYRKAKADLEEGGSNTLFLAIGMLRWRPAEETARSYRAPLILLPVKLVRRSARSKPYLTNHHDDPVFNLTLLQMLRQDFDISIPELAGELPTDESGIDVPKIWETVRTRVREVPGFEVVEEVVLSTFSFAKYLMWKDLADRTATLKMSPFVRHMIDTPRGPYESGSRFLDPQEIDKRIDPTELMAPLNADSSQIVAIHASGQGGDFVLEGPPGTGKSETIGNIIAHNIGLGRRVLFVSEKMAALEVVFRRLREQRLDDFCLELHSAKANKRAVIEQLGIAWENRGAYSSADWQKKAAQLGEVRNQLNNLVEALHAPGPAGISPRNAIGRVLRYGDVHRFDLGWERDDQGIGHASTPEDFERLQEIAKRLGQQFSRLGPEDFAAFEGIGYTDWSYAWQTDIAAHASRVGTALTNLTRKCDAFTTGLGIVEVGRSVEEGAALAVVAELVPDCASTHIRYALDSDGNDVIQAIEAASNRLSAYRKARESLSAEYSDARIPSMPIAGWIAERDRVKIKIWPFRVFLRSRLRNTVRAHFGLRKSQARRPEADLDALSDLADNRTEIEALTRELPDKTPWKGLKTDPDRAGYEISTAKRLREAATRLAGLDRDLAETRAQLAKVLSDERDLLDPGMPLATAARDFASAHTTFTERFAEFRDLAQLEGEDRDLSEIQAMVATLGMRERRLNLWCAWIEASRAASAVGLGALVEAFKAHSVMPEQAVEAIKTAYCRWVAPILIDARPELKKFSAVQHEGLVKTFREIDHELADVTSDYIHAKLAGNVPDKDMGGADPGYGVLSHELQKKTRHKPVRQMVGEMGDALLTLTPCLLMSPLSVAQFLPVEQQSFDLVVFDEASQITVPDAIGAIARGKNCVVVGDPKQMPPTRFFERGAEDDENEDARDLESILDEALAARVPHHRLTGHYRSRHESLICFSNHAYYQAALVSYPSADTRDTAVSFHRVDGVYAKGRTRTNEIEARAVVAEVVRRLRDATLSELSIGVVTLNSEQQHLVEDLLDQERRADSDLERFFGGDKQDPVFVKNLETVQGDERDVILLSIGYGPTEPGARTMSMNFGPLNRQGGERRLNVAITRATTAVLVFASFDASMLDLTRTSARAVQDLKHYIDFAARGPIALGEAIRVSGGTSSYDSDFEEAVADGLRRHGWDVRTQIGVSKFRIDLGIVHPDAPGRFLAGVECDGATYHSSPSARDRDRIRHIILEQLGWHLFRVWSTDYFLDPEAGIQILHDRLSALLDEDRVAVAEALEARATTAEQEGFPEEATRKATSSNTGDKKGKRTDSRTHDKGSAEIPIAENKYLENEFASPRASLVRPQRVARGSFPDPSRPDCLTPDPSRFYDEDYRTQLQAMASEIIDREGPVIDKRLSDRLARAHGFQRTGKQISRTVRDTCQQLRRKTRTPDGHEVFWPEGSDPQNIIPFRGMQVGGASREWREIPYPEKLGLVREVLSTNPHDRARGVAEKIGFTRLTASFRKEIERLVTALPQL